jgi:hypothetical protein
MLFLQGRNHLLSQKMNGTHGRTESLRQTLIGISSRGQNSCKFTGLVALAAVTAKAVTGQTTGKLAKGVRVHVRVLLPVTLTLVPLFFVPIPPLKELQASFFNAVDVTAS